MKAKVIHMTVVHMRGKDILEGEDIIRIEVEDNQK